MAARRKKLVKKTPEIDENGKTLNITERKKRNETRKKESNELNEELNKEKLENGIQDPLKLLDVLGSESSEEEKEEKPIEKKEEKGSNLMDIYEKAEKSIMDRKPIPMKLKKLRDGGIDRKEISEGEEEDTESLFNFPRIELLDKDVEESEEEEDEEYDPTVEYQRKEDLIQEYNHFLQLLNDEKERSKFPMLNQETPIEEVRAHVRNIREQYDMNNFRKISSVVLTVIVYGIEKALDTLDLDYLKVPGWGEHFMAHDSRTFDPLFIRFYAEHRKSIEPLMKPEFQMFFVMIKSMIYYKISLVREKVAKKIIEETDLGKIEFQLEEDDIEDIEDLDLVDSEL